MKKVNKECECCGKMMYGVSELRSVCDDCQQLRNYENKLLWVEKSKHISAASASSAKIERDVYEAERLGLSYGKYKLRMMGVI